MAGRPRVGISRCLIGDAVRYDGGHKRADDILETLGSLVEWVTVCPEVEAGMGTPREPIELIARADGVRSGATRARAIGVTSRKDWTAALATFAAARAESLRTLGLAGFVLKARSPSCGPAVGDMRGLFAQALIDAMPGLPIADEEELRDAGKRAEFVELIARRASS